MVSVFSLSTSGMVLTLQRRARTLRRMLTTPLGRAQIAGGHLLALSALVLVRELLLALLGQFAPRLDRFFE